MRASLALGALLLSLGAAQPAGAVLGSAAEVVAFADGTVLLVAAEHGEQARARAREAQSEAGNSADATALALADHAQRARAEAESCEPEGGRNLADVARIEGTYDGARALCLGLQRDLPPP